VIGTTVQASAVSTPRKEVGNKRAGAAARAPSAKPNSGTQSASKTTKRGPRNSKASANNSASQAQESAQLGDNNVTG
jgi:hypothetical protein